MYRAHQVSGVGFRCLNLWCVFFDTISTGQVGITRFLPCAIPDESKRRGLPFSRKQCLNHLGTYQAPYLIPSPVYRNVCGLNDFLFFLRCILPSLKKIFAELLKNRKGFPKRVMSKSRAGTLDKWKRALERLLWVEKLLLTSRKSPKCFSPHNSLSDQLLHHNLYQFIWYLSQIYRQYLTT